MNFPEANSISIEQYEDYVVEKELDSLLNLVFYALKENRQYAYTCNLCSKTQSLLKEKGYYVTQEGLLYRVSW